MKAMMMFKGIEGYRNPKCEDGYSKDTVEHLLEV